ncbi:MAG TPA: ectoine synthase [Halothiobacillus sp.]|nr:ectoine synthase [Halothiobacillus sp.]
MFISRFQRNRATTQDLRLICIFNPPVTGTEVHDGNGVYPLLTLEESAY